MCTMRIVESVRITTRCHGRDSGASTTLLRLATCHHRSIAALQRSSRRNLGSVSCLRTRFRARPPRGDRGTAGPHRRSQATRLGAHASDSLPAQSTTLRLARRRPTWCCCGCLVAQVRSSSPRSNHRGIYAAAGSGRRHQSVSARSHNRGGATRAERDYMK